MASRISWIHPVRIAQVLFGVAVFGLIIYILTAYQFDNVTKFMLFNGIWTGFVVTPYLALAPVHFHKFVYRFVIPTLETSTFILWLVAVILLGISLPSPGICDQDAGCEATQAVIVLAALECALFLVTAIRGLVNSVRAHVHHTTRTQAEPAPEASGAMHSV